ncbi:MAG: hypothetical protein AAGL49_04825, partial [Pseudomonadota bacterium]
MKVEWSGAVRGRFVAAVIAAMTLAGGAAFAQELEAETSAEPTLASEVEAPAAGATAPEPDAAQTDAADTSLAETGLAGSGGVGEPAEPSAEDAAVLEIDPAEFSSTAEPASEPEPAAADAPAARDWGRFQPFADLVQAGGPIIVLLAVISMVSLAIIFAKLIQFTALRVGDRRFIPKVAEMLREGDRDAALDFLS